MLSAENSFFQSHLCQLSDCCLNKMYKYLKLFILVEENRNIPKNLCYLIYYYILEELLTFEAYIF